MTLPVRVFYNGKDSYFGFGPSCSEVEFMTSEHRKGQEPAGCIAVFDRLWVADKGSFVWDGVARLNWTPIL